jgi:hypothetical protein
MAAPESTQTVNGEEEGEEHQTEEEVPEERRARLNYSFETDVNSTHRHVRLLFSFPPCALT